MIIFYDKATGKIEGTIDGRIHSEAHLKMWVGEKDKTERLVVNWKPVKWYNQNGKEVKKGSKEVFTADYEPDHSQKDIFKLLDKQTSNIYNYSIDITNKKLIKKK